MSEKVIINAKNILSGKIDPDELQSRYVVVYSRGIIGTSSLRDPIKAANYMTKFGWRAIGVGDYYILLEREA